MRRAPRSTAQAAEEPEPKRPTGGRANGHAPIDIYRPSPDARGSRPSAICFMASLITLPFQIDGRGDDVLLPTVLPAAPCGGSHSTATPSRRYSTVVMFRTMTMVGPRRWGDLARAAEEAGFRVGVVPSI